MGCVIQTKKIFAKKNPETTKIGQNTQIGVKFVCNNLEKQKKNISKMNFFQKFFGREGQAWDDQQRPLSETHLIDRYVEEVFLVISNRFMEAEVPPAQEDGKRPIRNSVLWFLWDFCRIDITQVIVRFFNCGTHRINQLCFVYNTYICTQVLNKN